MSGTKNILIYRLGSLGDTVIALPVFHKILECYPDVENITLLTNKPVASRAAPLEAVLGSGLFFNEVISYPVGTRNPLVLAKLVAEIRKRKIHTVINITALRSPEADKRDKLFFKASGVKELIGFDHSPEDYTVQINPRTGFYEWETSRLVRKIQKLGSFDYHADKYWDLKLTNSETAKADELLTAIPKSRPFIAMNIGTKMEIKDWGIENWVSLVRELSQKFSDYFLVIIGVDEETPLAEACLNVWQGEGINLCGKSSPRVSAAILKRAELFIGHDSGPMHLAACMGTPCVAIFSCLNQPRQWFPRGDKNKLLFPQTDCARGKQKKCINNQKCILTIKPSEVESAVLDILGKRQLV